MRPLRYTTFLIILFSTISCESEGGDSNNNQAAAANLQNPIDTPQLSSSVKSGIWLLQQTDKNNNLLGSKIPYIIVADEDDAFTLEKCGDSSQYLMLVDGTYQTGLDEAYSSIPALKKEGLNSLTGTLLDIKWNLTHYKDRTNFGLGDVNIQGNAFGNQRDTKDVCSYMVYELDADLIPRPEYPSTIHIGMTAYDDLDLIISFYMDPDRPNDDGSLLTILKVSPVIEAGGKRFGGSAGWWADEEKGFSSSKFLVGNQINGTFRLGNDSYGPYVFSGSFTSKILF